MVEVKILCFRWLSSSLKFGLKGFPRYACGQAIVSFHVVWVHFNFNSFPDKSIHIFGFRREVFLPVV
jgi:hypothetical protein